jgi:hypothetical protein
VSKELCGKHEKGLWHLMSEATTPNRTSKEASYKDTERSKLKQMMLLSHQIIQP